MGSDGLVLLLLESLGDDEVGLTLLDFDLLVADGTDS